MKNVIELPIQYILKRWTKDAKKNSVLCDHVKPASANDKLSVTSRRNELMRSVYEIFTKSATTTRHTEMCQRKVREMIELVENDMEQLNAARDGDEKENKIIANNVFDDVEKTDCFLNSLPILDPLVCDRKKSQMQDSKATWRSVKGNH